MLGFLTVLSSLVNTTTLSCKNEDKCSSCILYVVLFSIFFTIGIVAYFVHFHNAWIVIKKVFLNMITSI